MLSVAETAQIKLKISDGGGSSSCMDGGVLADLARLLLCFFWSFSVLLHGAASCSVHDILSNIAIKQERGSQRTVIDYIKHFHKTFSN
jgi:hypothetical protein